MRIATELHFDNRRSDPRLWRFAELGSGFVAHRPKFWRCVSAWRFWKVSATTSKYRSRGFGGSSAKKGAYLFLIDSGSFSNIIDSAVAGDSTRVYNDGRTVVRGIQGRVKEVGRASRISLAFAGFRQDNPDLLTVNMEKQNDAVGIGLAGILGMPVLR